MRKPRKKAKLAPREKKIVLGGSILAGMMLIVYFVLYSFLERKQALETKVEQKTTTLKQYNQVLQEKEALQARKRDLEQRLERGRAQLLNETTPALASVKLSEIVDSLLLKIIEIQKRGPIESGPRGPGGYQKVMMPISFQCPIDQLVPVLYALQSYDKGFLGIEDLTIEPDSPTSKEPKSGRLRVQLKLSMFIHHGAPEKKDEKEAEHAKPLIAGLRAWG